MICGNRLRDSITGQLYATCELERGHEGHHYEGRYHGAATVEWTHGEKSKEVPNPRITCEEQFA